MVARMTIVGAAATLFLIPVAAQGACVGEGRVSRVVNNAAANSLALWVTPTEASGAVTGFSTSDPLVMKAVLAAHAKNMTVEVTGTAAACSVQGDGGAVQSILKKSQPQP